MVTSLIPAPDRLCMHVIPSTVRACAIKTPLPAIRGMGGDHFPKLDAPKREVGQRGVGVGIGIGVGDSKHIH